VDRLPPRRASRRHSTSSRLTSSDGSLIGFLGPSIADDPGVLEWWAKIERLACSPGAALSKKRAILAVDVRHTLARIRAPTLIVHSIDHALYRLDHARYLCEHIANARLRELPGADHWPLGDALPAEIEEFITGVRPAPEPDRMLTTLLFTDIVDSTTKAAALGDHAWRSLLDTHDRIQRECVAAHGGRIVDWAGDGVFATFDSPVRALRCATALRSALRPLHIELRAGVHTGEVEVDGQRLRGITVHIGARIAASAAAGETVVSSTVRDLVGGSALRFEIAECMR
jgi:class 3 adenylate cyclase